MSEKISRLDPELFAARRDAEESVERFERSLDHLIDKVGEVVGSLDRSKARIDGLRERFGDLMERLDTGARKADDVLHLVEEPLRKAANSPAVRSVREHPGMVFTAAVLGFSVLWLLTSVGGDGGRTPVLTRISPS
jgi:ElaB/YqjD/DUF883 family membrane-anchored ribosome-binding protein